jgi:hypothetical protein
MFTPPTTLPDDPVTLQLILRAAPGQSGEEVLDKPLKR